MTCHIFKQLFGTNVLIFIALLISYHKQMKNIDLEYLSWLFSRIRKKEFWSFCIERFFVYLFCRKFENFLLRYIFRSSNVKPKPIVCAWRLFGWKHAFWVLLKFTNETNYTWAYFKFNLHQSWKEDEDIKLSSKSRVLYNVDCKNILLWSIFYRSISSWYPS